MIRHPLHFTAPQAWGNRNGRNQAAAPACHEARQPVKSRTVATFPVPAMRFLSLLAMLMTLLPFSTMACAAAAERHEAPQRERTPACAAIDPPAGLSGLPEAAPDLLDYARCAAQAGRPALALVALQRVLALEPGNAEAVALRQKLHAGFTTQNQEGAEPSGAPAASLSGWLALELGEDSNINSGTGSNTIVTPHLNSRSLTLNRMLVAQHSMFAGLNGGVEYARALGDATGIYANALAALRYNGSNYTYLPHNYGVALGAMHRIGRAQLAAELGATQNWIAGYHLKSAQTLKLLGSMRATDSLHLAAFLESGRNRYPQYDGLGTREDSHGLSLLHAPSGLRATLYTGREKATGTAKDLDRSYDGYTLTWARQLDGSGLLKLAYGSSFHRYDEYSPLFLTYRKDRLEEFAAGYEHPLAAHWKLVPKYLWETNYSNIPLTRHTRTQWLMELKREF